MKQLQNIDDRIEAFRAAVRNGIKSFEDAGRLLVEILTDDPSARERILDGVEGMTEDTLATFERIGRKQLFYRLCLNEGPGVKALRNCPYSEQVKYTDEPIDLLIAGGGKMETLKVSVWAMIPPQVKQVFSGRRIRSLAEQRAWLEGQRVKPSNVAMDHPYTVRRGKIVFHTPCEITVQQLLVLLQEATA